MTRKNKLIILVSYLTVLCLVMFIYRGNRAIKIKKLQAELAEIESEKMKSNAIQKELARISSSIPSDSAPFSYMEQLFQASTDAGLKLHEVTTEAAGSQTSARPGAAEALVVKRKRIRVQATGSYRSVAEYIRNIQNMKQLSRIIEMKLSADEGQTKGSLLIEFYSLPVPHAM